MESKGKLHNYLLASHYLKLQNMHNTSSSQVTVQKGIVNNKDEQELYWMLEVMINLE